MKPCPYQSGNSVSKGDVTMYFIKRNKKCYLKIPGDILLVNVRKTEIFRLIIAV